MFAVTGQSRRYAFLEYEHTYEAIDLLEKRCGILINGSEAIIEMEYERILPGWKPRRYGGGFGGQKESGQLRFGGVARPFKKPF
ncbi:PREDICTED: U11/U12 small nuclear ribonucleoprotein 35 kDa protein-like [Amphimedon queenslandica]|uniref:RRM domain-containing protein n=1 Tax=Amphimedon queenslandica TaxID=400682 RepID=A0AAN0J6F8_AMPQE|nr:PREDICTED: U11/U12 small nuclear ribonucleoprotein 35 kDa protein-like [Amphimedon queenslandica]|eukprot:XP_019852614.1 PREDICTED: U11/U12 small nuclear ribonucleoprotein 35 kDa protein-like [Amphimedon queenslandica]